MKRNIVQLISGLLLTSILFTACTQNQTKTESNSNVNQATTENENTKNMYLPKEIDSSLEEPIDSIVQKYIDNNTIEGGVILAAKDGKIVFEKAYGYKDLYIATDITDFDNPKAEKNSEATKTTVDTVYDLASCTKVMATTQSIMKLYYEGKIKLDDKVSTYLPDFAQNGKENVTIEQLLTHTSGLPQWEPTFLYIKNDRDAELEYIEKLPLIFETGEVKYSDFGFMTLGFIVEAITGMGMDEYVENEIYKPLGMTNTMYNPLDKGIDKSDIAATSWGNPYEYRMVDEENYPEFGYDCSKDKEAFEKFTGWRNYTLVGEANDGNAGMANGGVAGHAGVFSTVEDLAILGQLMLNGGEYNGVKLYDKETIDLFSKNHLGENNRGYGFELEKTYMGEKSSSLTYGHNGFTGTHVMFDPENNAQIIVLTNKQNIGLNEKGSYASTFSFVGEVSDSLGSKLFNNK